MQGYFYEMLYGVMNAAFGRHDQYIQPAGLAAR